MWEVAGEQERGWRIEEICVAEGLEAEICSIRKDELRREMFAGWRREENTCFLPAEMLVCVCCSQVACMPWLTCCPQCLVGCLHFLPIRKNAQKKPQKTLFY